MNTKTMKKVSLKTNVLLLEWLKSLLTDEQILEVNDSNFKSFLPKDNYFFQKKTLYLSAYTPKWVRKILKIFIKKGIDINTVTLKDIENYRVKKLI